MKEQWGGPTSRIHYGEQLEDESPHLHSAEEETEPERDLSNVPRIATEHWSEPDPWSAGPSPQGVPKPCCASVTDTSPYASSQRSAEMI